MSFLPFPIAIEFDAGAHGGYATENRVNKADFEKVRYLNFGENSQYDKIKTVSVYATAGAAFSLDILNFGLGLGAEYLYFLQNWDHQSSSSTQTTHLGSFTVSAFAGFRPGKTWDLKASLIYGAPLYLSSKRLGGDDAGDYKLVGGQSYSSRVMLYGLRKAKFIFGAGGQYTLVATAMRHASDSSVTRSWYASSTTLVFETRWDFN